MKKYALTDWLPTTAKEVKRRGWEQLDVILFSGDAYIDHPSFGPAVVGRIFESFGLKIAIVPQPNVRDNLQDFTKLGKPRLFFAVTAGSMDSMISNYTASKKPRDKDAYSPGGEWGNRPDYASIKYSQILKNFFPDVPILIGGIEASLRRVTHYDYWSDQLKPSILIDSGADLLVYGMGEQPLREVVRLVERGVPFSSITSVKQTAFLIDSNENIPKNKNWEDIWIHSHELCLKDKKSFAQNFKTLEVESNMMTAKRRILQRIADKTLLINPTYSAMTEKEIDAAYELPFTRMPHPKYRKRGPIPAYEMIKHSINIHRGCFGGCSFCTISAHQGKFIASRSKKSIVKELNQITEQEDFKGYISDIGGPSANMYKMKGYDLSICEKCTAPSCIDPVVCSNLDTSHKDLLDIYKTVDAHPKVKKAFVGSGIRYDLVTPSFNKKADPKELEAYLEQLMVHHTSGRLKVAPEHTSDRVLKMMRKPSFKYFHDFKRIYDKLNIKHKLRQQLVPYFISSHPNGDMEDMANLAAETKAMGFQLEQVQDFTPTPMTVATVAYYSGYHPYTLKKTKTVTSRKEKLDQWKFFFWYKPENRKWIKDKLLQLGRKDLLQTLLGNDTFVSKRKAHKKKESFQPHHRRNTRRRR
jgi:uncharacterized radical SAM protein YgiQ